MIDQMSFHLGNYGLIFTNSDFLIHKEINRKKMKKSIVFVTRVSYSSINYYIDQLYL